MQTSKFIFQPETGSLWTWVIFSAILLLLCIFLMIKLGKRKKVTESGPKANSLYFLLVGIGFLLFLTTFSFNVFNLIRTQACVIENGVISVGSRSMNIEDIRKTKVHREGSGVPFQGVGVNSMTSNSLVIEAMDGKSIILSEDFYPVNDISQAIRKVKKK